MCVNTHVHWVYSGHGALAVVSKNLRVFVLAFSLSLNQGILCLSQASEDTLVSDSHFLIGALGLLVALCSAFMWVPEIGTQAVTFV